MKNCILFLALIISSSSFSQDSNSPLVSFDDYERLMSEVKEHRKTRLVDLNTFNEMSLQENVFILDTRSKEMYDRKHVKGAIHLNFSDFTQESLDMLFPDRNATILIYCNNNFMAGLDIAEIEIDPNFASKVSRPVYKIEDLQLPVDDYSIDRSQTEKEIIETVDKEAISSAQTPITLALNIPTYINLFGYGYKNVYELSELVYVFDSRIQFEGSEVAPREN